MAGLHLLAGDRRVAPALAGPGYWLFALPDGPVRLVDAGSAVTRLRVVRREGMTEIPPGAELPACEGEAALLVEGSGGAAAGPPSLFLPGDSHPGDAHVPARLFAALHPVFADWRGPAPKPPTIVAARLAVMLARPAEQGLVLVGRSSGARVATGFAAARPEAVRAVVVLGYPFFPQGALPEPSRFAHLAGLAVPTLILQGRQDPYGGEAVRGLVQFSPMVRVAFIDATHELQLSDEQWDAVARLVLLFLAATAGTAEGRKDVLF